MPADEPPAADRLARLAPSPAAWLAAQLPAVFAAHRAAADAGIVHRPAGVAELLAHDAAIPRGLHARLRADGASRAGATTALAASFGGLAAMAVGFGLIAAEAGFLVSREGLRWSLHPDGWADAVVPDRTAVLVPSDHPWTGFPGVEVVPDPGERAARIVGALVEAVRPVIDAVHRLGSAGRPGLWNEVADGLAFGLVYQELVPPTPARARALQELAAVAGTPWNARPEVEVVPTVHGDLCVLHRGGCCLVFTGSYDAGEPDEDVRAYRARFPPADGEPDYCITCPRRRAADREGRQRWWFERERARSPR